MNETTFVINQLDYGWDWQDMTDDETAELYCNEELEVPEEWIDSVECYNSAFRISLQRDRTYFRDDWYVNLQRLGIRTA